MNTIFIFYPKIRKIKSDFAENLQSRVIPGGDKRDRTADLLNAIQALSQLSYTPICSSIIFTDIRYYISSGQAVSIFYCYFIKPFYVILTARSADIIAGLWFT